MSDLVREIEGLLHRRTTLANEMASIDTQLARVKLALQVVSAPKAAPAIAARPINGVKPTRALTDVYKRESSTGKRVYAFIDQSPVAVTSKQLNTAIGGTTPAFHATAMAQRGELLRCRSRNTGAHGRVYYYAVREDQFAGVPVLGSEEEAGAEPAG